MSIDAKTIEKLEELSMLSLSHTEKEALKDHLDKLITMIDKLSEVDTESVQPLRNVNNHKQVLREDVAENSLSKAAALSNATTAAKDFFVVPKVIKKKQ